MGMHHEEFARRMESFRPQLQGFIAWRLSRTVRRHVDVDDILQEVHAEAWRRISANGEFPDGNFLLWLRRIARDRCIVAWRKNGPRVSSENVPADEEFNTLELAELLAATITSPSSAANRLETAAKLHDCLNQLSAIDREMLHLRHFEGMKNKDCAELLGLEPEAASIRYRRAIVRLDQILRKIGFAP